MKCLSINKSTYTRAKGTWVEPDRGSNPVIFKTTSPYKHTQIHKCACVRERVRERVYEPRGVCEGVRVCVCVKVSVCLYVCVCQRERERNACVYVCSECAHVRECACMCACVCESVRV